VLGRQCRGEVTVDEHTRRLTAPAEGGTQQLVEVIRVLAEAGVPLDDVGLRRPTLDDVFLSLTGHAAEDAAATPTTDEPVPAGSAS
jgi:ABC-2 type transport system ATP-binding protein